MDEVKKEDIDAFENTKSLPKPQISFEDSLAAIQRAASELVGLQKAFKDNGGLNEMQKRKYAENLEKLGISAQKLANVQDEDDYRLLLEEPQGDRIKGSKKKPENIKFPPYAKKPVTSNRKEECGEEEHIGEEGDNNSSTGSPASPTSPTTTTPTEKPPVVVESAENEAVAVSSADTEDEDNSSVAEAKPVGLAIAGNGGVASSKPVGTAVVGPGGLAVARPVATAIAGVRPSDVSALGLSIPSKLKDLAARGGNFPSKGKYGLVSLSDDDADERVLIGPHFFTQARLSDRGSSSSDYDDVDEEDRGLSRNSDVDEESYFKNQADRQVEPAVNSENPYGQDLEKQPQFQPSYENIYNYLPNPYLPPFNFNLPLPIFNQYLRRSSNVAGIRYPSAVSQFPQAYGVVPSSQAASVPYTPFTRYVYV